MTVVPARLDPPLAQSIVDRTMQIIGSNVNVMDHRGIIIASGDPARIGSLHEGAALVLAQGRTVEIDQVLAGRLHDARPGINLPLRAEGEIVGVIGLSGEPEAIRHFAELLRMAAETMLEQARLSRLLARDARLREELVLQLAGAMPASGGSTAALASRLGVDATLPRIALVIELLQGDVDVESRLIAQQGLSSRLLQAEPALLAAALSLDRLVVLLPLGDGPAAALRARVERLCAQAAGAQALRIAVGGSFAGAGALAHSYRSACATLRLTRRRADVAATSAAGRVEVHHYTDLGLAVLLAELGQGWQADALRRPAAALIAADRNGVLRDTLQAWFAERMNTAATARALGVHRNTLDHRLRRVETVTGLAIDTMEGAMALYLALQLGGIDAEL